MGWSRLIFRFLSLGNIFSGSLLGITAIAEQVLNGWPSTISASLRSGNLLFGWCARWHVCIIASFSSVLDLSGLSLCMSRFLRHYGTAV